MTENALKITARNGWINGHTEVTELKPGETLGEFVNRFFPADLRYMVRAQKNGQPFYQWKYHKIEPGEHVLLYLLPQGGDSGKQTFGLIATIALAVAAGPLATSLVGQTAGIAFSVTKAAIMIGGSLIINSFQRNMVKPPPQPSLQQGDPFFKFTGTSNEITPLGPVSRIYGNLRVYPKQAAPPNPINAADTIYYTMLFDFGYGPLQVHQETMKLGETLVSKMIENDADAVKYLVHENFTDQNQLQLFTINGDIQGGLSILIDQSFTTPLTTSQSVKGAIVKFSFPQGLYKFDEYQRQQGSFAYPIIQARKIGTSTYQDIFKLAIFSVAYAGNTYATSYHFFQVDFHGDFSWQVADYDQWVSNGITYEGLLEGRTTFKWVLYAGTTYLNVGDTGFAFEVGDYVKPHGELPVGKIIARATRQTAGGPNNAYVIYYKDYTVEFIEPLDHTIINRVAPNGPPFWQHPDPENSELDGYGNTVKNYLLLSYYKPYQERSIQLYNKRNTPFETAVNIQFIESGQYDIRVRRSDPRPDSLKFEYGDFYWTELYSLFDSNQALMKPLVPHTVIEMKIKATDTFNNQVPPFSAVVTSKLERYVNGSWTDPEPTSNPAWIYCDILCGSANKYAIAFSDRERLLDLDRLTQWAQYCDDNGFECNIEINGISTVKETLQTVTSTGRAAPARNDAKYSIVRDTLDTQPVQLITPKNTNNFSASIGYVSIPHGIKCTFKDRDFNWEPVEVTVYADGYNEFNAKVFEDLSLPGVTSYDQVFKMARYFMAQAVLQRERISCSMDIENLVCQRGDVVLVANDVLNTGGLPRRIVAVDANNNTITLDEPIAQAGDPYFNQVSLLLHFDADFSDNSSIGKTVTPTNVTINNSVYKWIGSADFTSASLRRYLSVPYDPLRPTDFNFDPLQDFTIQCWIRNTDDTANFQAIFANQFGSVYSDGARFMMLYGANAPIVRQRKRIGLGGYGLGRLVNNNDSDWPTENVVLSETEIELDRWYHVACTRKGNYYYLFINGVLESITYLPGVYFHFSLGGNSIIGTTFWDTVDDCFAGYIEDLEITRAAKYIANFEPPINPLDNDYGLPDTARLRIPERLIHFSVLSPTTIQFGNSWDLTDARLYTQNTFPGLGLPGDMRSIKFNDDGSKLFALGSNNADPLEIREYTLATPYDISNIVYSGNKLEIDILVTNSSRGCFAFKPDGTLLVAIDRANFIKYYTLSTPWDLNTAVQDGTFDLQLPGVANDCTFEGIGHQLFVVCSANILVTMPITTAWDMTTMIVPGIQFNNVGQLTSITIRSDGISFWVADPGSLKVREYLMGDTFELNTLYPSGREYYFGDSENTPRGMTHSPDERFLFIAGTNSAVSQYYLTEAIASDFHVGDLFEYGVTQEIRSPFIVEEITAGQDFSANLRLVEQRLEIDVAINRSIPDRAVRPGATPNYRIDSVIALRAELTEYVEQGVRYVDIDLVWQTPASGFPSYYNIYELDPINGQTFLGQTTTNRFDVETVNKSSLSAIETRRFEVTPYIERIGSGKPTSTTVVIEPDTTPPPDVTRIQSNAQTEALMLFWPVQNSEDIHHYEIRYSAYDGSDWGSSTRLVDNIPATATETMVALRPGWYFIKAVDGAGNYSVNAAKTKAQIEDLENVVIYQVLEFQPFQTGTYNNTTENGGVLQLDPGSSEGEYYPVQNLTFSKPSKVRLTSSLYMQLLSFTEFLSDPWFTPLENATPLSPALAGVGINQVDAQINYRFSDGITPIENSPWTRLIVADLTATEIEFSVVLGTINDDYLPVVSIASVIADWVERTESNSSVSISATQTLIEFEFAFKTVPTVQIMLQNANVGEYIVKGAVNESGFFVSVYDSNDNPIAATIDWIAHGYGKEYEDAAQVLQQYNARY